MLLSDFPLQNATELSPFCLFPKLFESHLRHHSHHTNVDGSDFADACCMQANAMKTQLVV